MKNPVSWTGRSKKRLTFMHELNLLRTIFNFFIEYEEDEDFKNPVRPRHFRDAKLRSRTVMVSKNLSHVEVWIVIPVLKLDRKLGKFIWIMFLIQFWLALRVSEVAAIYFEDVILDHQNPSQSKILIRRSAEYLRKKGVLPTVRIGYKNSSNAFVEKVKELPLSPELYNVLKEYCLPGRVGLMFQEGGCVLAYKVIYNAYNRAFKKAKLPYSATHVLRHGGARHLLNETGDLTLAQQLLGNASLSATQVYAQRSKSTLDEHMKKQWEKVDSEGQLRGKSKKEEA